VTNGFAEIFRIDENMNQNVRLIVNRNVRLCSSQDRGAPILPIASRNVA
jgi:hypothetical protein